LGREELTAVKTNKIRENLEKKTSCFCDGKNALRKIRISL